MRELFLSVIVVFSLAGILCQLNRASAGEPELFQIGKIKVWAIADNTGDRDMSVFVADAEIVKQYAPTGKSPSGVLCFLLDAPGGLALVDTGNGNPPGDARASLLMDGLKQIGVAPEKIGTVIITHMHGDHIGGLAWEGKPAFPNATVQVGFVEHNFWLNEKSVEQFPNRKANFERAKQVMDMYDGKVALFQFGGEVIPGLTAMDARGHTPGHAAFLLESDGDKLLIVSDLIHSAALQFARPDINTTYDMDPAMARISRLEFLGKAARENLPIAGIHLPFPGIGRVKASGPEAVTYHPGL